MSFKLYPPGTRGPFYTVVGRHKGRWVEKSTKSDNRQFAERFLKKLKRDLDAIEELSGYYTFGQVAEAYMKSRPKLSEMDRKRVGLICFHIGHKPVNNIIEDDIFWVANQVYGEKAENSTKNRYIITPASAVLNYAVRNKWRSPIKLKRYKPGSVKPRYVTDEDKRILMNHIKKDEDKTLLMLWLFNQGDRITDSIGPSYEDFDFVNGNYNRYIGKSDKHDVIPVDNKILKILRKRYKAGARGKIFHYKTRWGPSKWLRETSRKLGIYITPHMCRHTLGKRLNDGGVGLKSIMQVLGQSDPRSAIRYQTTGIEELRVAKERALGKALGQKNRKSKKAL